MIDTTNINDSHPFRLPEVFIYGLSGSGKDTIANYLRDNYGYMKVRLAKTIKQIICETNDIEFEKLDTEKRINPNLRSAHWEMGKILDTISQEQTKRDHSLNRLSHLLNKTSIEFETAAGLKDLPLVFCDVRIQDEMELLLEYYRKYNGSKDNRPGDTDRTCKHGIGIFLAKNPEEFVGDGKHKTEQNFFHNGLLERYIAEYSEHVPMYLIMNNRYSPKDREYLAEYWGNITDNIYFTGTDMQKILELVDAIITDRQPELLK